MSKHIKYIPLASINRMRLYINTNGKPLKQIVAEEKPGLAITGNFYDGKFKPVCPLKTDGIVCNQSTQWNYPVLTWDRGPDVSMKWLAPCGSTGKRNHIANCCGILNGSKQNMSYGKDAGGKRGRAGWGLRGSELAFVAFPDGEDGMTPEGLRNELHGLGWADFILGDGGGKVNYYCKDGNVMIQGNSPSQNLILVDFIEEENKPTTKKFKVCIDSGHGVETAGKCAPDKSYYEHEFNLDISNRQKAILERHGIEVHMTRANQHDVTLEQRVKIANGISGLDLFISNHSNASGNGNDWTSPDGYGVYTSAAGATANRNILANKLIAQAKKASIKLWGSGLFHELWYVCKNTVAPAVLVEHGFHTNKAETALLKTDAYRQQLAEVDCKGILDYLGVKWIDAPADTPVEPEKPIEKPWYAEDQAWAIKAGISDGERPEDNVTRAEVWAMLHRATGVK